MSRRFKIERDCYEDENYLYKKGHVTFQPGLTVLVGCNGCGKTTMMKQLENILKKDRKKARVFRYENEIHGGHSSMQEAMFYGDMSFVAASVMSSEGEKISLNMQKAAAKIGSLMKKSPDIDEFWLLLDGVDSGFSIDAIEDLKRGLFDTIFEMYPDKEIYIIVSANEYEMARGEMCFDVVNCRYVNIKSYDRYRKIVMKSREYKDERIKAAVKRDEAGEEAEAPDDSVNLRSPSPDVDGVSDSPYTSSNLRTDGQPKVGRGLPSIDEDEEGDEVETGSLRDSIDKIWKKKR